MRRGDWVSGGGGPVRRLVGLFLGLAGSARMTLTAGTTVVVPLCWGATMPIATPDVYAEMLDRAKAGAFASACLGSADEVCDQDRTFASVIG